MELIKIGQMARKTGVSEQTLRLYDKMGLLSPKCTDPVSGYRYYDTSQYAWIDTIQYMKALGMQLKDIKAQLDHADLNYMKSILSHQLEWLDREQARIESQRYAIENALASYALYDNSPPVGVIVLQQQPERLFVYKGGKEEIYSNKTAAQYNIQLHEMWDYLKGSDITDYSLCNVGTIVRGFGLTVNHLTSHEIITFIDKKHEGLHNVELYPAGIYLTIYCDRYDDEYLFAEKMLQEIREKQYTICGDYICEELTILPSFNEDHRNVFFRLQIPVKSDHRPFPSVK